jgi:pyridoxal phosphate enzyme (YggS family)
VLSAEESVIRTEWNVAEKIALVRERIAEAALRAGRQPEEITLIGVSKTHEAEEVVAAVRAGLEHIGENRVREAADKFPVVRRLLADSALSTQHSAPVFHMVGHLQSNKAGSAVELFDRVDAVDSVKVAQALSRRINEDSLPILVEVYVGADPRRPGVRPDELVDTVGQILDVPRLRVEGLMTVAPLDADPRTAFAQVRTLKETLSKAFPVVHFGVLSMGMSDDYLQAIQEGSTEVRIGTALFGPRKQQTN